MVDFSAAATLIIVISARSELSRGSPLRATGASGDGAGVVLMGPWGGAIFDRRRGTKLMLSSNRFFWTPVSA